MTEERRRRRFKLCWRIQLRRREGAAVVWVETENISSKGFYCKSQEPLSPGDLLECDLFVPDVTSDEPELVVHNRVRVVRLEMKGLEPGFGVACEFEPPLGSGLEDLLAPIPS